MNRKKKLPDLPSELLRVALADLEKCEAMPEKYKINMGNWHWPQNNGLCAVCLAGSTIAQTIRRSPRRHVGPADLPFDTELKLLALNDFKDGMVGAGLDTMGLQLTDTYIYALDREVAPYWSSPANFKLQLHELAWELEQAGL